MKDLFLNEFECYRRLCQCLILTLFYLSQQLTQDCSSQCQLTWQVNSGLANYNQDQSSMQAYSADEFHHVKSTMTQKQLYLPGTNYMTLKSLGIAARVHRGKRSGKKKSKASIKSPEQEANSTLIKVCLLNAQSIGNKTADINELITEKTYSYFSTDRNMVDRR